MEAMYPYFLVIHLVCAIIFLGFIFTDVVLLSVLKKHFGKEMADKIFSAIVSRGVKIMPLCLVLLILTGGAMISRYIGGDKGFFETSMQQFLVVKMIFALCIVLMVIISIGTRFVLKKDSFLDKFIHPLALFFGFLIVLCAKLAFF